MNEKLIDVIKRMITYRISEKTKDFGDLEIKLYHVDGKTYLPYDAYENGVIKYRGIVSSVGSVVVRKTSLSHEDNSIAYEELK